MNFIIFGVMPQEIISFVDLLHLHGFFFVIYPDLIYRMCIKFSAGVRYNVANIRYAAP
jgi:hypothetical protein